ncbi:MAG: prolyl-tRNA synthetase associated domain-containing protein [Clostridia bacterium]|nr:prolyl-tRNA synthetase associated domain-containing protein [Clostridia bacterium]
MTDTEKRTAVIGKLDALGIKYTFVEHGAVYTMEEAYEKEKELSLPDGGITVKNLFLKEHNSDRFFLVVTAGKKNTDIKMLRRFLGTKPLSFASEEELTEKLGVTRGAVTPLAVINDTAKSVSLIIDDTLKGTLLGVHPNENTSTLFITYEDLEKYAESCGHTLINMQV